MGFLKTMMPAKSINFLALLIDEYSFICLVCLHLAVAGCTLCSPVLRSHLIATGQCVAASCVVVD